MNRMGRLALFSLLVGISSNLFADSISGVIYFTGAIVEPPCSMNASQQGESRGSFRLSGCPMHARTADVSIRSMRTGEVRSLQPSGLSLGGRDFSARYDLAASYRRPGSYLVTVSYP
ncbi:MULTISPECIES: type 1 fimbrial protein [Pseudomonas aeruginosa group]|uniref:type 1 fimbrial protein n=1 Tax=Pseudomonas aeruginosa group TaxID=136841 RepID=UPI0005B8B2EA|nr:MULTISPECIES: type 1 fimbrial protein [Pseudomonas aeruginosa group]MDK2352431.1 type 1 fimbrial protein [Pseudomonas paraeruginosa]MEA8482601.1 type 1 fimbrial protein [Pseudomonas aeruginosa]